MNAEQTKKGQSLSIAICFYIQLLILCDVGKTVDDAVTMISFYYSFPFDKYFLFKFSTE